MHVARAIGSLESDSEFRGGTALESGSRRRLAFSSCDELILMFIRNTAFPLNASGDIAATSAILRR